MKIRRLIYCTALLSSASIIPARAQQLFPDLLTPAFRSNAGTEFTHWDIFTEAYAAPDSSDHAAAASDPTITQTLTSSAFLTSGFNIYSFAEATGFELANNVSSTLGGPLTNLVFQYDTPGTAIDLGSIHLHHSGGTLTLANANVITEYRIITGGFGGFTNHTAIQWNLTGFGITDYTITFESLGSSNSFNAAMLDTSINAYAEIVPSSRTWDNGAGNGLWSSAANWSGNTVTTTGGVQGHAPSGANGALGNGTSNVTVGYDPGTTPGLPAAQVFIDGNFTIGRTLSLTAGTLGKVIGGRNTTSALYSGNVLLATTTDNVFLRAEGASDVVTFSGQITGGGTTKSLTKDGAGTVIFSVVGKNYGNATTVAAGTLQVASGTAVTGHGSMTVASGATLLVHGSLSGSGTLAVNGGTLGGSGTISRAFALDTGDVLSPGASVGTLNTIGETWAGGGRLRLEINDVNAGEGLGWDLVNLAGTLRITATSGSKFTLEIDSLTLGNTAGLIHDWKASSSYSWQFLNASSPITGFVPGAFAFDLSGFQNPLTGTFSVSQSGNDLFLNYAAIPEPSSALLFLSGTVLFLNRYRHSMRNH